MKQVTWALILFVGFIAPLKASDQAESVMDEVRESSWTVEGNLQFHSVSEEGKPMIGPSINYMIFDSTAIGLRTLLGLAGSGSYTVQFSLRQYLSQNRTRIYVEPTVGYHILFSGTQHLGSAGLSLGVDHPVGENISIGGSAGLEVYKEPVSYLSHTYLGNLRFSPKMVLVTTLHF